MKKLKRYLKRMLGIKLSYIELIDIMLENQDLFESGMCSWVLELGLNGKLNYYECFKLERLIMVNMPETANRSFYWWECGDIEPRIEFLEQLKAKYD